jgi:hypothetical protein
LGDPHQVSRTGKAGRRIGPLLAAAILTFLNCLKPLHIDDTAYYCYAAHIAERPLDPYGFEIFWYQKPQPAHEVLAPPVVLYWWAGAIRLFGDRPMFWKLGLLPFHLLLTASLFSLFRRFARGWEVLLLWATVLSPVVLPSCNLMLDVPALGLSLAAVVVFLHACDRNTAPRAVLAGLLAGVALETKYTALVVFPTLLWCGLVRHRLRLCSVALAVAMVLFGGWEWTMARLYGASHFFYHGFGPGAVPRDNPSPFLSLITLLGGTASMLGLLGLVALRVRTALVIAAGTAILLGYAWLVGLGPAALQPVALPIASFAGEPIWSLRYKPENVIFGIPGLLVVSALAAVCRRLLLDGRGMAQRQCAIHESRESLFLVGWLILEIAGHFALTPFPAVRRVMGIFVVATILIGRLASRMSRERRREVLGKAILIGGIGMGLVFYAVDMQDALAEQRAAAQAADLVRGQSGTVWFVGHWGFQYYAARAGMQPVAPDRSRLRRGDWLVIPDAGIAQQSVCLPRDRIRVVQSFNVGGGIPLRTVAGYYGSRIPIEPRRGPRVTVTVVRVTADFVPTSGAVYFR